MSERWDQNWLDLIQKYGRDRFGRNIPMEKLQQEKNHKIWGWYMDALAFYKMKHKYFSLDDIPEWHCKEGNYVDIREPGKLTQYTYHNGEWQKIGSIHDSFYKG